MDILRRGEVHKGVNKVRERIGDGVEGSLGGVVWWNAELGLSGWATGTDGANRCCIILERGEIESSEFGPEMGGAQTIQRNR